MPTPTNPLPWPLVNGDLHSWVGVEMKVQSGGLPVMLSLKAINYKSPMKPSPVYGTHPQKLGSTVGIEEPEADFEATLEEVHRMIQTLGPGYKQQRFTITVSYSANGLSTVVDTLVGCRIIDIEAAHAQGPEALYRKVPLDVIRVENSSTEALLFPLAGAVAA